MDDDDNDDDNNNDDDDISWLWLIQPSSLCLFPTFPNIFRHMLPHAHDLPVNDGTILPLGIRLW